MNVTFPRATCWAWITGHESLVCRYWAGESCVTHNHLLSSDRYLLQVKERMFRGPLSCRHASKGVAAPAGSSVLTRLSRSQQRQPALCGTEPREAFHRIQWTGPELSASLLARQRASLEGSACQDPALLGTEMWLRLGSCFQRGHIAFMLRCSLLVFNSQHHVPLCRRWREPCKSAQCTVHRVLTGWVREQLLLGHRPCFPR